MRQKRQFEVVRNAFLLSMLRMIGGVSHLEESLENYARRTRKEAIFLHR